MGKNNENVLSKKELEQMRKDALNEINSGLKDELVNTALEEVKKEFDKVVNETKESISEDFNEEFKNSIKNDIKNELVDDIKKEIRKEEHKLSRRKSFKIFRLNIYLLLLIAACGFLVYKLYINGGLDFINIDKLKPYIKTTTTTTTTTVPVEVHDTEWFIKKYGYLLENVKISNLSLFNGNYIMDELDPSIKLSIAYKALKDEDIEKDGIIYKVEKSKLEVAYKNIFGSDKEFIVSGFDVDGIKYAYSTTTDSFIAVVSNEIDNKNVYNNIINIEEKNGNIVITSLVGIKKDENVYSIYNLETPISDNSELVKIFYTFRKVNETEYALHIVSNIE